MTARVSLVFPCFNEEATLRPLHRALLTVLEGMNEDFEMVFVDDHSSDETPVVLARMAAEDKRVRFVRLSKNSGSHTAIFAGLAVSRGDAAIVMAADLQDPPRLVPELLAKWREGAGVVWGVRSSSPGLASRIYYSAINWFTAVKVPPLGADVFLADRKAIDALVSAPEKHTSIFMLLAWLGFRSTAISYHKDQRVAGTSKWTSGAKIKLFLDTMLAFSDLPIRYMSVLGLGTSVGGIMSALLLAGDVIVTGRPIAGWVLVLAAVLVIGGIQMTMLGLLGEYLWRTFDESRRRPRFVIESRSQD